MIPEAIESACEISQEVFARRPKILYIQSYSSNPEGITMSQSRKKQIYDICETWNILIIEDTAYKEIQFEKEIIKQNPPIKKFDKDNNRVIYTCTTSKEVAVLRIGYSIMPEFIRKQFIKIKEYLDLCTPTITQEIANRYYQSKIDTYLPQVITQYQIRAKQ